MKQVRVEQLSLLLDRTRELYGDMVGFANELLGDMQEDGRNVDECVYTDIGFLMRELHSVLDDARKEIDAKKTVLCRMLAFAITQRATERGETTVRSVGKYAYGTPDVKMRPALPKPDTPEYAKLMEHFGINHPHVKQYGFLAFHWPRMSDYLTELAQEGAQVPPGCGILQPEFTMTFRKRK